ncbi:single-stranded DNA-binding protein [Streptococcus agalactiae]|uniref:single-stranded DNA-binding protein n=1 Tax=Streptococcus agalactiae TaxID=1311 RepID=UPI003DA0F730
MQVFISKGRVSDIPTNAVSRTANRNISFKFDFACDSSLQGNDGKPLTSFFHVQVYGKQAEIMAQSLSIGSPILVKGEIIQRAYTTDQGQRRNYQYIVPSQHDGITFLEGKEASNRRRQQQLNVLGAQTNNQQADLLKGTQSPSNSYPTPMEADEPF